MATSRTLLAFFLFFVSVLSYADEALPNTAAHEISKEDAIAMAQDYCRKTNREKYWRIDNPKISLRDKGPFKDKIWDISFPPIENGWGKSDLDPKTLTMMQMLPFMMIVFIETGEMKYNQIEINGRHIDVVLMPAKHPAE